MNTAKLQYPCLAKRYFSTPNSNNDKPNNYTPTTTTTTPTTYNDNATNNIIMMNTAAAVGTTSNNTSSTSTTEMEDDAETAATSTDAAASATTTASLDHHHDSSSDGETSNHSNNGSDDHMMNNHHQGVPWKLLSTTPTLINHVDIQWKTRLDPYAIYLDSSLYSPIIYQFEHELTTTSTTLDSTEQQHSIILVRPLVVYDNEVAADDNSTQKYTSVLKNNQVILKGDLEIAMTRQKVTNTTTAVGTTTSVAPSVFKGHSKIQFTDSSYHHFRKAFRLIWNYYTVKDDKEQLIYSTISTPFRVFARKPTKKQLQEMDANTTTNPTSPNNLNSILQTTNTTAVATSIPATTSHSEKKGRKRKEEDRNTASVVTSPKQPAIPKLVEHEPSTKKVKHDLIDLIGDNNEPLNIRAVPTIVNSVATAVVSHLISQKENVNQELVMELFKTLTDINKRLERLENMSNGSNGNSTTIINSTSTNTTTSNPITTPQQQLPNNNNPATVASNNHHHSHHHQAQHA